jgi:hypothetical protein
MPDNTSGGARNILSGSLSASLTLPLNLVSDASENLPGGLSPSQPIPGAADREFIKKLIPESYLRKKGLNDIYIWYESLCRNEIIKAFFSSFLWSKIFN